MKVLAIILLLASASFAQTSGVSGVANTKLVPSQTGNSGKYLTTDGTNTSWAATTTITGLGTVTTGIWNATKISEAYGGTNQSTYTTGDLLYASASNTLSKLGIGSTGQILSVFGGIPAWSGSGNYLTADVTTFSTSFVDVTGMTFSVGANEVWEFRFIIIGANVNVTNCQLAVNGPTSPTAISATLVQLNSTVSVKRIGAYDAAFTPTVEAGSTYLYVVSGLIRNGSNAGTLALRMKSLDGNEAGVGANSFFSAQRLH
ncbi:MAG: hypothetical protein JSS75_07095 [Bacteroidetes bacterium]|nr:hypothetical protein [Bacteroidota bacterium]